MQERRPLGVTILAAWALVGSGIMFVSAAIPVGGYWSIASHALTVLQVIVAPLGFIPGTIPFGNAYIMLAFAAFFAAVGVYTLRRSRFAWFANVGMSVMVLVMTSLLLSRSVYSVIEAENISMSSELMAVGVFSFIALITTTIIRLYYLFWPNIRHFFNAKSLFVQKRTAQA